METAAKFRVMTYNAHRCQGTDRQRSPLRIAEVIAESGADIVALQEVDVHRRRTGNVDQGRLIADRLQMDLHFHSAWEMTGERYGDAILSRFPMELVQVGALPRPRNRMWRELRGALWTAVTVSDTKLQFINTHLGLGPRERFKQAEELFGERWLGNPQCQPPLILCGDFNARPASRVHRRCLRTLRDVHGCLTVSLPRKTYPTIYPLTSIDHVFLSAEFVVHHVEVWRTPLTRRASDHFPLIVDVSLKNGSHETDPANRAQLLGN